MKKVLMFILFLFMPFVANAEEIKIDWIDSFGEAENDTFYRIVEIEDGFITLGSTNNDPTEWANQDIWITRYDLTGEKIWSKQIDGNDWDGGCDLKLTSDSNLVLYFHTWSTDIEGLTNKGKNDFIIMKFDLDGNIIWKNSFGGNENGKIDDFIETNSGDFVAVGWTKSTDLESHSFNGGNTDCLIIKFDKNGNILWFDTFGGEGNEQLFHVKELNDNSLIINGFSTSKNYLGTENKGGSDVTLLKYSENGKLLWFKTWGGNGTDSGNELLVSDNNEIFLVGATDSTNIDGINAEDFLILKYDIEGNLLFQTSFGSDFDDYSGKSYLTKKGYIVVSGFYYISDEDGTKNYENDDIILGYLDNDGKLLWKKTIGGNGDDYIYGFFETENENIIAYGYLSSTNIDGLENKGKSDAFIVKYDKQGNLLWQHTYGTENTDYFSNLVKVEDENFIVSGSNIIVKYDKNGNEVWNKKIEGAEKLYFNDFLILSNGNFVGCGSSIFENLYGQINKGKSDGIILKYSIKSDLQTISSTNGIYETIQDGNKGFVKPVPDEGYEVDKIIVKDILGDIVDVTKLEDGTYAFNLYNDASVEVIFKEVLSNPKTGVIDFISIVILGFTISLIGFILVKKNCHAYEI